MLNALQINQKNYTILTFPFSNRRNFEDRNSAGRLCISILPEYCSSALTAQAYKMITTTNGQLFLCIIRKSLSICVRH